MGPVEWERRREIVETLLVVAFVVVAVVASMDRPVRSEVVDLQKGVLGSVDEVVVVVGRAVDIVLGLQGDLAVLALSIEVDSVLLDERLTGLWECACKKANVTGKRGRRWKKTI